MCINVGGGIHCAPKKLFLELIFFLGLWLLSCVAWPTAEMKLCPNSSLPLPSHT